MSDGQAPEVLKAVAVTAGYGGQPIIDGVCLSVRAGQITAVVGPNGAGKSTLLKALSGVLRITNGDCYLLGERVTNLPPEKLVTRKLGYVPQVSNTFGDLTVRENLEMGAYTRRTGLAGRINEVCDLFPDLRSAMRRRAGLLSGGQRGMLAIARALMLDPAVLLLDEPSSGLSPLLQGALWNQIENIAATGVGICVVEQNTRLTLRHAHWGYILVLGRNRMDGPAAELLSDEKVVDLYIGRMN